MRFSAERTERDWMDRDLARHRRECNYALKLTRGRNPFRRLRPHERVQAHRPAAVACTLPRTRTRARGAGRPAGRRTCRAASRGSGSDGPGEPPPPRPARLHAGGGR
jgi:hypothetical protein